MEYEEILGLLNQTDALLARNTEILFPVPDDLSDQVTYPLGLTLAGAKNTSAKALYEYMSTPEAEAVLKKYGFEVEN